MKLIKSALLGATAALATVAVAQAADLPSTKSAPVEYVRVCDVYGAGFFYIPGTQTCLKVGGYVRVDYDYRPERERTGITDGAFTQSAAARTTIGFYNRAAVSLDARTQTAWGTVQTFMRLRMDSGSGLLRADGSMGSSLEAAYVRFAGFTFGQAAHPFAFLSPWAYNTHHSTGWPNGVRQLAYTATFGGGVSATIAVTDMQGASGPGYGSVASADNAPKTLDNNSAVIVGNLRYDQAWGSAQVMAAWHNGGNLTGFNPGFAVGAGLAINLPMIAAGDRLEVMAAYSDRIQDLVSGPSLNTPSAGAYVSNPLGGPATNFSNGRSWQVQAQFRHYWTAQLRSQVYASYVRKELRGATATPWAAQVGSGTGYTLGKALIWSPTAGLDIGLELNYLRSNWNAAAASVGYTAASPSITESNWTGKLRVQRDF